MKIVIKNGRLIDGNLIDIEIEEDKILKVSENIENLEGKKVIDLKGEKYISSGWIDMHTHCFNKFKLYSDDADEIGYKKGVTVVVDAGTAGADTIEEFYNQSKGVKTRVFAFINIARQGIKSQDELSNLDNLKVNLLMDAVEKYKEFIVGVKARISKTVVGNNGITPLKIAKKASEEAGLPLMVHIGSEPPTLKEILDELKEGNIVSHIFNGKANGILKDENSIKEEAIKAYEKGVYFDIAHGKDSFNFNVAETARTNGIKCHSISTDIYQRNRLHGPVFDLATTMTKALTIGYEKEEVIEMVTKNPAEILGLKGFGELKEGFVSDITIFDIVKGEKELVDSNGNKKIALEYFKPLAVILKGEYIEIDKE